MNRVATWLAMAGVVSLLTALPGAAAPISSCVVNPGGQSFTCNVFESNANGAPSEISNIFQLTTGVTAGYIVLLEHAGLDQTNNHNWSDVLHLIDDGGGTPGVATTGQLLSDGCNGTLDPFSCFPTFAQVNAVPHAFAVQAQTGTGDDFTDKTVFQSGLNIYNIFSAAPVNEGEVTPEPGTMGLIAAGLVGAGLLARRSRHM